MSTQEAVTMLRHWDCRSKALIQKSLGPRRTPQLPTATVIQDQAHCSAHCLILLSIFEEQPTQALAALRRSRWPCEKTWVLSRHGPTSRCSSGYVTSGKVNYRTEAAREKNNSVRPLRPAQSNRPGPSSQWTRRLFTEIFKYQKRNICYCGQLKVLSYQAGKL